MADKVKAIPEHYHTLTPGIIVKGAKQAIEWYEKAFGAEKLGVHMDPEGKHVMHSDIRIGNSVFNVTDEMPDNPTWKAPSGSGAAGSITLFSDNARGIWERAVAAGGKVRMPLQDMFWGDRWGQLTDPFGHLWNIAQHIEDVSPDELMKRAAAAFGGGPPKA